MYLSYQLWCKWALRCSMTLYSSTPFLPSQCRFYPRKKVYDLHTSRNYGDTKGLARDWPIALTKTVESKDEGWFSEI